MSWKPLEVKKRTGPGATNVLAFSSDRMFLRIGKITKDMLGDRKYRVVVDHALKRVGLQTLPDGGVKAFGTKSNGITCGPIKQALEEVGLTHQRFTLETPTLADDRKHVDFILVPIEEEPQR